MERCTNNVHELTDVINCDVHGIIQKWKSLEGNPPSIPIDCDDTAFNSWINKREKLRDRATREIVETIHLTCEYNILLNHLRNNQNGCYVAYKCAILLGDVTIMRHIDSIRRIPYSTDRYIDHKYFLKTASANNKVEVLIYLLSKVNHFSENDGRKAIWCAVASNNLNSARLLLEWGTTPNIHYQYIFKHSEMRILFAEFGFLEW
jgi:hypothetical protein